MMRVSQIGQSMTEYLVVLGVTGAALLATTTDVVRIFDTVHDGYDNQSREMSRVQAYNNPKVRFNPNPAPEDVEDPSEPLPPYDGTDSDGNPLPEVDLQLPSIETVYDANGNQIGVMDGDRLIDSNGNGIGWCIRNQLTGDCVFQDEEGNPLFPGASTVREYADDDKNPLSMMVLVATAGPNQGQVVGFVYLKNNKYYSAKDGRLLDPQPTNVEAKPMRTVYDLDNGKAQISGYEYQGKLFSIQETISPINGDAKLSQATELVNVVFVTAPNEDWTGYQPCLVMPAGWNANLANGVLLDAAYVAKFNDPSIRLSSGSIGGFIKATAQNCGGASTVTYSNPNTWTLSK